MSSKHGIIQNGPFFQRGLPQIREGVKNPRRGGGVPQRGCCIRSPLVTKLFEVVLLHEDITQRDLKNSSHVGALLLKIRAFF